ncbi:MAG TPA: DUF4330 domain-containing protein [Oscillospiraceae bacterium]|nr:DUF4330 domain-containing protein [Oscillospiraceae bacterium]
MGNRAQSGRRHINPIDLIVVILILALGAVGAYKLLGSSASGGEKQSVEVTYKVKVEGQDLRTYESLKKKVPSQLMAGESLYPGYVVDATTEPCTFFTVDDDGNLVLTENSDLVNIIFTIQCTLTNGAVQTNKIGTQEIRIGKSHIVKTEYFELTGDIISMDWPE